VKVLLKGIQYSEMVKNIAFWKMHTCEELGKYCLLLCSYLVQVHRGCSNVKTHLQCLHVGAGSLLIG